MSPMTQTIFHQVAYLPMVADSPTKHSTIYEMLTQTKQKVESLNLDEKDLECDLLYIQK